MASNKGRAFFTLAGYMFNPNDITQILGIEPTSVNTEGSGSGMDKPKISSWELSSEQVIDDVDTYALTDAITKQLEPIKDKIIAASKSHNLSPRMTVELVLSIDKGEVEPEVGFGARTLRFLTEIGAFINIDYKLAERI